MPPETLFAVANAAVLPGWIALLASPLAPRLAQAVAGLAIPLALSVGYAALILAFLAPASDAGGGFGTLAGVMALFAVPEVALAGWVHYLAFDLLIGALIVRRARAEGLPFALVLPCLPLTFLAGPAGWLLFQALRAIGAALRARQREVQP